MSNIPASAVPTPAGLAGRTVVVTGAGAEIGGAYVRAFAATGANVVAVDLLRTARQAMETTRTASRTGPGRAVFAPADVTSQSDWRLVVERTIAEFGRLDVLVNNAAVYRAISRKRPLTELVVEEWDHVFAVNVRGTWLGIKAVAPAMMDSGGGSIVNVSSVVGRTGAVGFAHYVASKAAVEGLTRAAARELGEHNVRVNAVAPGLVDNDASRTLNPETYLAAAARARSLPRPMTADDLIGSLLWLASPASSFVTGQTVVVDGGQVFT
ncbi:SDR family NAD(P)-dependent oxidoreductase [Micromonospora eburnea]|uniref:3-oxoacyl-[acyl-carrier protein] reductase n=1 Tax=Micromonospora eburnea TaxID=227316 RepID=A0A1C6UTB9_9ACTN|nr:SDR family NAD(P)-dependent oxidoreductase [Micromonospora eburnea]SCL57327.1 3-oxoacyl-[acyl-carrier protein] reductase [Micromonospora eburnea]